MVATSNLVLGAVPSPPLTVVNNDSGMIWQS
jgi:hypothetical protein